MSVLAPVLIRVVVGLESMVSTVSMLTVVYFRRMYGISDHIRICGPGPSDRVTSGLEGGISIYEAFL